LIVIFVSKLTNMKKAKDCQNIQEIRNCIDEIDYQTLALFAKRMEYVNAIVKFKNGQDEIVAKDRQKEVFQKRREWAQELGLNPDLFEEIYKTLINWNVRKEMELYRNIENIEI
jgi:isochorismate pyruvate lyase